MGRPLPLCCGQHPTSTCSAASCHKDRLAIAWEGTSTQVILSLVMFCVIFQIKELIRSEGKPKDLALGFCKMKCDKQLSCTHPCGLQCHWPQKQHNKQCEARCSFEREISRLVCFEKTNEALVDSPCARYLAAS